ncbi:hypothetical protein DFJ77DRAFT_90607 [Powellomyces hirtus]|nr:hypothetical protein DFJ77DRAFT_90607 [Powellomyces hirtus]
MLQPIGCQMTFFFAFFLADTAAAVHVDPPHDLFCVFCTAGPPESTRTQPKCIQAHPKSPPIATPSKIFIKAARFFAPPLLTFSPSSLSPLYFPIPLSRSRLTPPFFSSGFSFGFSPRSPHSASHSASHHTRLLTRLHIILGFSLGFTSYSASHSASHHTRLLTRLTTTFGFSLGSAVFQNDFKLPGSRADLKLDLATADRSYPG